MLSLVKYGLIGILNTLIHWFIFYCLFYLGVKQYLCNFIGFLCAVTFSYIINEKFNFKSKGSLINFGLFFLIMGGINLGVGILADKFNVFPIYTLVISSISSLFLGFFLSKYLVFKVNE